MVAPAVAPELMQPNVMVEIDHGPPMELHHEAEWLLPGSSRPHVPESMSAVDAISMSTLPLVRGEHELISDDVCSATTLRCGGNLSNEKDSSLWDDANDAHKRRMRITFDSIDQTMTSSEDESKNLVDKTKGLDGCPTTCPDNSHTPMGHLRLNDTNLSATRLEASRKEEIIVIGMTCSWPVKDRTRCGWAAGPYSMCQFSGFGGTAKAVQDRTSSDFPSSPLGDHDGARSPSIATSAGVNPAADPDTRQRVIRLSTTLTGQCSQRGVEHAMSDGPFKLNEKQGNAMLYTPHSLEDVDETVDFVVNASPGRMVEADGKPNNPPGLPSSIKHGTKERTQVYPTNVSEGTRSRGSEGRGYLELPASTSWATGPKTSSNVNAVDVSQRDILMWMIEYNLMNSPCESECLADVADQITELLLNMVAAAISCFHFLFSASGEGNLNAKQCTGRVHCLLKEPG